VEAAVTTFQNLKRTLEDVTRDAKRAARSRGTGTTNVSVRRNVKIASNVGSDDTTERVTSIQDAPIRQRRGSDDDAA
jgi:hypothetical protein